MRITIIALLISNYVFVPFRVPVKMTTKAPTFTQPLQSVVALEGSAATFEAHISGKVLFYSCKIDYILLLLLVTFMLRQMMALFVVHNLI